MSTAVRSIEMRPTTGHGWPPIATTAPSAWRRRCPSARSRRHSRGRERRGASGRVGAPGRRHSRRVSPAPIARICRMRASRRTTGAMGLAGPGTGCRHRAHSPAAPCRSRCRPARNRPEELASEAGMPGNSRRAAAKASICRALSGCGGIVGAGEVAHHQRDAVGPRHRGRGRSRSPGRAGSCRCRHAAPRCRSSPTRATKPRHSASSSGEPRTGRRSDARIGAQRCRRRAR